MARVKVKNMPRLRLSDLLRRRKMTLETFVTDSGVQTYEALVIRCQRLGCLPPAEAEYKKLRPDAVNSPSDGVVVLDPPPVIEEQTGRMIDPDAPVTVPEVKVIIEPAREDKKTSVKDADSPTDGATAETSATPKGSRRGRRRKKESQPTE